MPEDQRDHLGTPGRPWQQSRVFHMRPLSMRQATFEQAYARLSSESPSDYNFERVPLSRWPGRPLLPTFCSIAPQISVVHLDANPEGPLLLDHGAGQRNLFTGSTSGSIGLATLLAWGLKGRTRLPAVTVNSPGFALGSGSYARFRPLALTSPTALPTSYPGKEMAGWAREYEALLDSTQAARRPSFVAEAMSGFALDKERGDAYVGTLVEDSLKLLTARPDTAFGQTLSAEPVTNSMLREVFGVTQADVAAADILHDAHRSIDMPVWQNLFGLNGALAVRLLQYGVSVVAFTVGSFDTHAGELIYPLRTLSSQGIQVGRLLTGLEFALKNIRDPDSGAALWDSTLIVLCSEFGRQGGGIQENGFNTGRGSDHAREQYFPLMGGPLAERGQLITATGGRPYPMNSLWTSILAAMGHASEHMPADRFPPIPGLLT